MPTTPSCPIAITSHEAFRGCKFSFGAVPVAASRRLKNGLAWRLSGKYPHEPDSALRFGRPDAAAVRRFREIWPDKNMMAQSGIRPICKSIVRKLAGQRFCVVGVQWEIISHDSERGKAMIHHFGLTTQRLNRLDGPGEHSRSRVCTPCSVGRC